MSLSDLEKEILAEGEKLYAEARAEALKLRKSHLLAEIEKIEAELAKVLGGKSSSEVVSAPAEEPEQDSEEGKEQAAPAEAPAASEEPQEAPEAPAEDEAEAEDDKS